MSTLGVNSHYFKLIFNTDDFKAESEELIEYMDSIQRNYFVSEHLNNGINLRTAVATFTTEELENLKLLGDVICIDPAFDNMKTNWSMVPPTCIGSNRELLSAGVIYSSSLAADCNLWVLHKLINKEMPCSDKLKTLISDDDQGLNAAFTLNNNMI